MLINTRLFLMSIGKAIPVGAADVLLSKSSPGIPGPILFVSPKERGVPALLSLAEKSVNFPAEISSGPFSIQPS